MTIRWEDYAVVREDYQDEVDEGGFYPPEPKTPDEDDVTIVGGQWGQLRSRLTATNDEQVLLDEDFPEVNA